MSVETKLLTVQEIADELRISYASASRMIQSGEIPGFKVGRLWRVRESDFRAYVDGQIKARFEEIQRRWSVESDDEDEVEGKPEGGDPDGQY